MSDKDFQGCFAWLPVRAKLLRDDDAPVFPNWEGEPATRIVWLRFLLRRRENGQWVYYKPACPDSLEEQSWRQW